MCSKPWIYAALHTTNVVVYDWNPGPQEAEAGVQGHPWLPI